MAMLADGGWGGGELGVGSFNFKNGKKVVFFSYNFCALCQQEKIQKLAKTTNFLNIFIYSKEQSTRRFVLHFFLNIEILIYFVSKLQRKSVYEKEKQRKT
jgi:hypothetical protein